ncbi:MAG: hypothetical protein K8R36_00035 [Planctomycetales bacterium]|nr:hypothetical protein [Planctomycetales bacterium]
MTPRRWFIAAALLAAVFFTGCGSPASKLIGKWQLSANAGDDKVLALLASTMKGEMDFKGDGSFSITSKAPLFGDKSTTGTWKFVKSEGQAIVLSVKAAEIPEREARLEFTDNDHFSMVPFEVTSDTKGMKFDFARIK